MAEIKYTKHLLTKVEDLFKEINYTIRYAKGNFQSGYCIVEHQNIAVINKFYDTEGRINVLIDILDRLDIQEDTLSEKAIKTYKQLRKKSKKEEAEEQEEVKAQEETETQEEAAQEEVKAQEETETQEEAAAQEEVVEKDSEKQQATTENQEIEDSQEEVKEE